MLTGVALAAALNTRGTNDVKLDQILNSSYLINIINDLIRNLKKKPPLKLHHLLYIKNLRCFSKETLSESIYQLGELAQYSRDPVVARILFDWILIGLSHREKAISKEETELRSAFTKSRSISPIPLSLSAIISIFTGLVKVSSSFHGIYVSSDVLKHEEILCLLNTNFISINKRYLYKYHKYFGKTLIDNSKGRDIMISLIPECFFICTQLCNLYGVDFPNVLSNIVKPKIDNLGNDPLSDRSNKNDLNIMSGMGIILQTCLIDWALELIFEIASADPIFNMSFVSDIQDNTFERSSERKRDLSSNFKGKLQIIVKLEDDQNNPPFLIIKPPTIKGVHRYKPNLRTSSIPDLDEYIDNYSKYALKGTIIEDDRNYSLGNFRPTVNFSEKSIINTVSSYNIKESALVHNNHVIGRGVVSIDPNIWSFNRTEDGRSLVNEVNESDTIKYKDIEDKMEKDDLNDSKDVGSKNIINVVDKLNKKVDKFVPGIQLISMIEDEEIVGRTLTDYNKSDHSLLDDLNQRYEIETELIKKAKKVAHDKKAEDLENVSLGKDKFKNVGTTQSPEEFRRLRQFRLRLKEFLNFKKVDLEPCNSNNYLNGIRSYYVGHQVINSLISFIYMLIRDNHGLVERFVDTLTDTIEYLDPPNSGSFYSRNYYLNELFFKYPELFNLLDMSFIPNGKDDGLILNGLQTRKNVDNKNVIKINSIHYSVPNEKYGLIPEKLIHGKIFHFILGPLLDYQREYWGREKKINLIAHRISANSLLRCLCKGLDNIGNQIPIIFSQGIATSQDYFRVFSLISKFFIWKKDREIYDNLEAQDRPEKPNISNFISRNYWRSLWMPMTSGIIKDISGFINNIAES